MSETVPERSEREIEELLGAYALDADEAAAVEQHLRTCVRCAAEVASYHKVTGLLANSGGDAPVALWEKIAERLDEPGAPSWDLLAARLDPPPVPEPAGVEPCDPSEPGGVEGAV